MALIKFGMMMTDARGKLGGQVFTKTRSGATVRTKVTPTNPQTAAQQRARSILSNLSSNWRGLDPEQRAGWNSGVDQFTRSNVFGDRYAPSGKNLFVGLNANLALVGITMLVTLPALVDVPSVIIDQIEISTLASEITISYDNLAPGASFSLVYQASRPMSQGRYNFSGAYATFFSAVGNAYPSASDLWDAYIDKFGAPSLGQKVAFKVFVIANASGQKSVESVGTAIA
jgi:hypothetical protein